MNQATVEAQMQKSRTDHENDHDIPTILGPAWNPTYIVGKTFQHITYIFPTPPKKRSVPRLGAKLKSSSPSLD